MSETPVELTADEIRQKRQNAAARMMLRYIGAGETERKDRDLYAMNLARDLSETDRVMLLEVLFQTFPPDIMEVLAQSFFTEAGMPGVELMEDPMADAKFWADGANAKELKAYAIACFRKMAPKTRQSFLEWAKKGADK